ncbi:zinc finger BED domain-containing protein RICESLEEPER 2-like [Cannabis sativa]|uniref:zinc finger BED domain-containing protein RICESLEEPER 2-like n=1 Tax=Cannabis sativa TaxID=3483 RepID=UPI0029CA5726|nr:zinc finger BED domain-containing protein RICESLEEPER 2-like [Cannabis sativa]
MSGQIDSNFEDDVDFVKSTTNEVQSVSNTVDETQNQRKRTSRAWDHFTRQKIDGKIIASVSCQILSFKYVPCPHDAPTLLEALRSYLNDWKIEDKISTVTLENYNANDAMIDILKGQFEPGNFILKKRLLHVRCCAHILNLIVKEGLSVIGDSVDKIRNSVAYWSGTPKRHEKFEDTTRQLGVPYTKKISVDCVTRWNSTFLMLSTALSYKTVFERARLRELRLSCVLGFIP